MRRWLMLAAVLLLSGCLGNGNGDGSGDDGVADTQEYDLPETVTGMEFAANGNNESTRGIWIEDGYAYLSGADAFRIVDVRDPAAPVTVAADVEGATGGWDVDMIHHPDGNRYAVLSRPGSGVALIDVTDPTTPTVVSEVPASTHNIAVVPNSTIVYNSRSISLHLPTPGTTGQIDIIDFADPAKPVLTVWAFPAVAMTVDGAAKPVDATTCHDITFEPAKEWALCAGVTETHVWDISDPADPSILQVIDWPGTNIHHAVWSAHGGDLLVLGDEVAGVAAPVPACSDTVPTPTSALWFFDASDLAAPTPVGYFQIAHDHEAVDTSGERPRTVYCSTHFGTLIEDRDMLVMGWYTAGTVLVDFSDPANARQVAHYWAAGTNTWEARYHNGHIYTGDTGRGMDILRLT